MTGRVLRRAVSSAAARMAAERGGLVFAGLFYLMVTAVLTALWSAAAGTGLIAGYSALALTWYVATSEAATIPLEYRLIEEVGDDIASGAIAAELLRPASVVGVRIASAFGRVLPKLAVCAGLGLVFAVAFYGAPPSWAGVALAAPALVLALLLNLVAQHGFAAAAFWINDAKSTWFLYQKLVFVLGGMLLPIEVLPDAIEGVARWLPTAAMAYVPARLAAGYIEPELLLVQVGWLAVLTVATVRVFAAGERRLQVVGG